MAMTFQEQYDMATDITKDDSAANVTRMKAFINGKNNEILSLKDWFFMEKERTATSVASQQNYRLPADYGRLLDFWTVVGGVTYHPTEVFNRDEWLALNETSVSSDITTHFTVIEDYIYLYPIPSSTSATLHTLYRKTDKEMTAADYVTGTITATAGSRNIVGVGTTFTAAMVGRWIRINGLWYQIDSLTNTTNIALEKASYEDAAGASYKIGEMSCLPGEFHDLLCKGAVADYFDFKGGENPWRKQYEQRLVQLIQRYGGGQKTSSQVITSGSVRVNPNDYPTGLHA